MPMQNPVPTNVEPLTLYMIGPEWGLPSMSPFGTKLATWLRIAGIEHDIAIENDPRKGPKGKSPWIELGGQRLGDSELIIRHLTATRGVDPDRDLSETQKAIGLTLRRSFEEHFHQVVEYALWVLDEGWQRSQAHFDSVLPRFLSPVIKPMIRKQGRRDLQVRGLGRHGVEEIASMAADDLRAASVLLGDNPFFFGAAPTTTDATMYGFLIAAHGAPIDYFAKQALMRHANLVAYCARMTRRFWPELAAP